MYGLWADRDMAMFLELVHKTRLNAMEDGQQREDASLRRGITI